MATLRWRKVQPVTHSIQFGPVERHPDRVDKFGRLIVELEHDPERWKSVFGKEHAQTKSQAMGLIQRSWLGP